MESNSVSIFLRGPPKEHSCQIWSKLALQFGKRRCLQKLLTRHNGRHLQLFFTWFILKIANPFTKLPTNFIYLSMYNCTCIPEFDIQFIKLASCTCILEFDIQSIKLALQENQKFTSYCLFLYCD